MRVVRVVGAHVNHGGSIPVDEPPGIGLLAEGKGERRIDGIDHPSDMVALEDIGPGEPIVLSRFARPEELTSLSNHIPDGMRAVTLRLDKVRGVAGFITQGDYVDLIGSFSAEGRNITKYVLTKVKILAMNTVFVATNAPLDKDGKPLPSPAADAAPPQPGASPTPAQQQARDRIQGQEVSLVTFEVPPAEAERLIVASEQARLYLVLRSPSDKDSPKVDPVDSVDVYVERKRKESVPKVDIDVMRANSRGFVAVRVELDSVAGSGVSSSTPIYYVPSDKGARELKEEDYGLR